MEVNLVGSPLGDMKKGPGKKHRGLAPEVAICRYWFEPGSEVFFGDLLFR
jgi:hypothetical protein